MIDNLELSRQHTTRVDVTRVRLDGLIVTEDLSGGCGRHGSKEETVSDAVLGDVGLEGCPVVEVGRCHTPHVLLKDLLGIVTERE